MGNYTYPEDRTGGLSSNLVTNEEHILTPDNHRNYHFIIPKFAPFYGESIKVFKSLNNTLLPLEENKDYHLSLQFTSASLSTAKPVFGGISFVDLNLDGTILIEYRTIGGKWTLDTQEMIEAIANIVYNPRGLTWDQITNKPETFGPTDHTFDFNNLLTEKQLGDKIEEVRDAILQSGQLRDNHADRVDNPHHVTLTQLGAPDLEGKSIATIAEAIEGTDPNKLITAATLKSLLEHLGVLNLSDTVKKFDEHIKDNQNPHNTIKHHLDLDLVSNLEVATLSEVISKKKVEKYVTLDKLIDYIRIHGCATADEAKRFAPKDSLLSSYCKVYNNMGIYADGYGGTYEKIIEVNSNTCGYTPPAAKPQYPAKGTILTRYCVDFEQHGLYADGYGGSYSNLINQLSPACGYTAGGNDPKHPEAGTILGQYCDGTTQVQTKANGKGGSYEDRVANSPACKAAVTHPAAGTILNTFCKGVNLMGNYADGNGGKYEAVVQVNSTQCGYTAPVPGPTPAPPAPSPSPSPSTPTPDPGPTPANPSINITNSPNIFRTPGVTETIAIALSNFPANTDLDIEGFFSHPNFNNGQPISSGGTKNGKIPATRTNAGGSARVVITQITDNDVWKFGMPTSVNPARITNYFIVNGVKSPEFTRVFYQSASSANKVLTASTNTSILRMGRDGGTITVRGSGFEPNRTYILKGFMQSRHFNNNTPQQVIDTTNSTRFAAFRTDSNGNANWSYSNGIIGDVWSLFGISSTINPLDFTVYYTVDEVRSNTYNISYIK